MAAMTAPRAGRYALRQNSEINVTPFVDVMLVLLIVMMVATPMATVSIALDLPPPGQDTAQAEPPTLVSVRDDGAIWVTRPHAAPLRATIDGLPGAIAAPTDARLAVRADRHVRYRAFMDVLNRLKAAGYTKVGLVSEKAG